ncbi:hypothetical protein HMN09_00468300 [Mycena chlorophos]|uniref:Uncharacterized protein n=1 Tax=Mycena chlorophos TaxID=658473 RepID=A0A8H6WHT1_MYCCL|nr:hypothetical protein HMN09_00468300 [Mycena chlorophos]
MSTLPPELERRIFEAAASAHRRTIPTLLLVAQRVSIWIEPILYRTLHIPEPRGRRYNKFLNCLSMKNPAFLASTVKCLLFFDFHGEHTLVSILEHCTGVTHLALRHTPFQRDLSGQFLALLDKMQVVKLGCNLDDLVTPIWSSGGFGLHPMLTKITHLHIHDKLLQLMGKLDALKALSGLTHIAVQEPQRSSTWHLDLCHIIREILTFDKLQALVVLTDEPVYSPIINRGLPKEIRDTRLVLLPRRDPRRRSQLSGSLIDAVAVDGSDFWMTAEGFIQRKSGGEISDLVMGPSGEIIPMDGEVAPPRPAFRVLCELRGPF